MSNSKTSLFWFRQDLRITDNPGLLEASRSENCLLIYILDDTHSAQHQMGAASRAWLHHSLTALQEALDGKLNIYHGDPLEIIPDLIERHHIDSIYWNRCYEPWRISRDKKLKERLTQADKTVKSFNASLLWEPWEIKNQQGEHYKVFTPFYRKGCLNAEAPRTPLNKPAFKNLLHNRSSINIDTLKLLPQTLDWAERMMSNWQCGEAAAIARLDTFLQEDIDDYKSGRNFPAQESVSRLSPYLHFGEISPHQIWHTVKDQCEPTDNTDHFLSELAWREFSYSLLYHYPSLPQKNLQEKFDAFPWEENTALLRAWQKGQTGIPIVDAGMRELWQTGFMHNRVRMIVASFLVKNLLIHWHQGEAWFWDCLVDADLANNSASWQWVAGCGADAAPYFRIFNPVTQGQKFDPEGEYTKRYVPELKKLDTKYFFNPWEAPPAILEKAEIELGKTYPKPITDLKTSRQNALNAYDKIRTK